MSQQGTIAQVIGPVVDVSFPQGVALPKFWTPSPSSEKEGLDLETQKHIGEDTVRAISMDSTEGLSRGMKVTATGRGITMPTGEQIKGRLFNVGDAIDGIGATTRPTDVRFTRRRPSLRTWHSHRSPVYRD